MSQNMMLQINQRGSWRTVVAFDPVVRAEVQQAVIALAIILGDAAAWRVSKDGRTALAYLEAPGFRWQSARR